MFISRRSRLVKERESKQINPRVPARQPNDPNLYTSGTSILLVDFFPNSLRIRAYFEVANGCKSPAHLTPEYGYYLFREWGEYRRKKINVL